MFKSFSAALLVVSVTVLSACGGGSDRATLTPGGSEGMVGVSADYIIPSNLDGADISFTLHEPTSFNPAGSYPLILNSHGYGGSKVSASSRPASGGAGEFARLLDAGYAIISIDQRGFGQSGGKVRILDPYFEGQDLLQIIDWAEANLPWLAYDRGNLVLGSFGGSYGGGYQHLIYAIDPEHRLDAMVPEITWNDLRYSLFSNGVFKTYWATLLSAVGNTNTPSGGGQDTIVNEGLAQGIATNSLTEEQIGLLYQNSLASYCNGENPYAQERLANAPLTPIDSMYWQGIADTLFNLNEEQRNVECLSALGGDVRLLTKNQGHDNAGNGGEQCGRLSKAQAMVDWFDEKLKGSSGKADYIPKFCYHLDGSEDDAVVLSSLPQANQTFEIPVQSITALEGSPESVEVVLMTAGPGGAVVAGVPTMQLTIADPLGLEVGDPIVFMTLARRAPGAGSSSELEPNLAVPFRGYVAGLDTELLGVSNRLAEGEELRLVISASYLTRYPSSGSVVATPVDISGSVSVPVFPGNLPAPPAN